MNSKAQDIVAVDIGGTHARFAIATIQAGKVLALSAPVTLLTSDYASLTTSWEAFGQRLDRPMPRAASIAVACPIVGDVLKLTNNPWVIRPASLQQELNLDALMLLNDFAAMGHAVPHMSTADLHHVTGPDVPLPEAGVITIIGPGTGFGVAHVLRQGPTSHVIACEGGHIDFAPLDSLEDAILVHLRKRYRRVSVERLVSGPGLANIYESLAAIEGKPVQTGDDKSLWQRAIAGTDHLARAALDRFCLSLGAVAGDLALVHGAVAVVITGGIAPRIADLLPHSGFADRFVAKGRFERMMADIPVKLITHPQPGLLGVAAAFAAAHHA